MDDDNDNDNMTSDYSDNTSQAGDDIDVKIAYHEEMEHAAIRASNYAKAAHHRNEQNILLALKENQQEEEQQPFKTPEQISDEDYKVAPTSADNFGSLANNNRSFPEWRNLYNVDEAQIEKLPWFSRELDSDLKQELENSCSLLRHQSLLRSSVMKPFCPSLAQGQCPWSHRIVCTIDKYF